MSGLDAFTELAPVWLALVTKSTVPPNTSPALPACHPLSRASRNETSGSNATAAVNSSTASSAPSKEETFETSFSADPNILYRSAWFAAPLLMARKKSPTVIFRRPPPPIALIKLVSIGEPNAFIAPIVIRPCTIALPFTAGLFINSSFSSLVSARPSSFCFFCKATE